MKTTLIYAGIGSRQTPPDVLAYMRNIASRLAARGYLLRSGAADGADSAFEAGCTSARGQAEIWLPWQGFNHHADTGFYPTEDHARIAEAIHPAWDRLTRGPKALHARNVGQILGADLDTPVSFVLCWTPDAKGCESEATRTRDTGGTGTAIVLASRRGIPVFNLANADAKERLALHVLADCRKFHPEGGLPAEGEVFVYGDNLAHRHGKGAALVALKQYGAVHGKGGLVGLSYGIPTKDGRPGTPALSSPDSVLSLASIRQHVDVFIAEAKARPDLAFFVTRVGCGLAGYADADIAPMFAMAPSNCSFPDVWKPWLGRKGQQTKVVHIREAPYDVYIGRKNGDLSDSFWRNPWVIGQDGSREEVVARYARYVQSSPEMMAKVASLRGRTLGCWCKTKAAPHTLCHGDVLAALAEGREWAIPEVGQRSLF